MDWRFFVKCTRYSSSSKMVQRCVIETESLTAPAAAADRRSTMAPGVQRVISL